MISSPIQMTHRSLSHPPSRPDHPIFPTDLCRMCQLALISQLGHQPHMCAVGDITPAMGASVYEGHPDTIQPTQTSADSRVLCGGYRETSPSMGSRSVACVITPLSFPVLRGPRCVPFRCQSYGFQRRHVVDRILHRDVLVHHIDADVSA